MWDGRNGQAALFYPYNLVNSDDLSTPRGPDELIRQIIR